MSTGKISDAIRSLTEKAKSLVLTLIDKVDKKKVLDIVRGKHPEPSKTSLNFLVSNEKFNKFALPSIHI